MKKTIVLLSLTMSAGVAAQDSLLYRGQIDSVAPIAQVETPDIGLFAGVKEYELTAENTIPICDFVGSADEAANGLDNSQWRCHFEWTGGVNALEYTGDAFKGIFPSDGEVELTYNISVYSGRTGRKVTVYQGSYPLVVQAPEAPVVETVEGIWTRSNKSGYDQVNYDALDALRGVRLKVKPQPYDQVVEWADGEPCVVREGSDSCDVYDEPRSFGDRESNLQGTESFALRVDAATKYFNTPEDALNVEWDYRPPSLVALEYHIGADATEEKVVSIAGQEVTLQPNEAILALNSPHIDLVDEEFWKLKDDDLLIRPSEGAQQSNIVKVGDRDIRFNIPNYFWRSDYDVDPLAVERVGDLLVYRYSLDTLPDGKFDIDVAMLDHYGNGESLTLTQTLIDRFPPIVKALFDTREMPYGGDVYFLSDLGAVASGGWDDGTHITSMTLGGHELPLGGAEPNVQYASVDTLEDLVPGEQYELVITAEDGVGHTGSASVKMTFNPASFMLSGIPDQLYHRVQSADIYLVQNGGRCTLASSAEVAALISQPTRKGCTIEWDTYPTGMSASFIGWTNALKGAADELGEQPIGWSVVYHNKDGKKLEIASGESMVNVVPSSPIELTLRGRQQLAEGVYGRQYNTDSIGNYRLKTNPAAITLTQQVAGGAEASRQFGQLPFDYIYELSGNLSDPQKEARPIWERVPVDVIATYDLAPDIETRAQVEVIQLPDQYVNAYLSMDVESMHSQESTMVKIDVGLFDRSSGIVEFDPERMGTWQVYPASRVDGVLKPLGVPVKLEQEGGVSVEMSGMDAFDAGGVLYAVADIESPHPEYTRQIISSPHYIEVLKGSAVEGELDARRLSGRVPFYATLQYQFDSAADRKVATNMRWETSSDGVTWSVLDAHQNSPYSNFNLQEAQQLFVRLKIDNSATGEVTVSETIELNAYENAQLGITGPTQAYAGQEVTLVLTDQGTPIHSSEGIAQWSLDNGVTWTDGDVAESFTFENAGELVQLKARFRLSSTSSTVGDDGWTESSYYLQVVEPRPLNISARAPSLAEAGSSIALVATAYNPYSGVQADVITQWTMPDGTVRSELETSYLISEGELDLNETLSFGFAAWVDGYKEQTYAEREATTRGWAYEFPQLTLTLNTNVSVAPSNIYAIVNQPYVFAPGVTFGYEWLIDETKARIEYQNGRSALIVAEESGVQQIQVRAFDNRGNEELITAFIDVLEPEVMTGSMRIYASNQYYRAPLILNTLASADPGHPRDYATEFSWELNGEPIEGISSANRIEITEPGVYDVSVNITTKYGQVEQFTETVTVIPNEAPYCEPQLESTETTITVKTNCRDNDGRIIAYRWLWDGQEQGPFGTQIRFSKHQYPNLSIEFFAIDDSGADFRGTFEW